MAALQLWAGPECTVNRVGDAWRDQLLETGFAARLDDLDRIASLGVRRVRLPLLWERCCPELSGARDWRWSDACIARLQRLGLPAIAGLVHHGSGPAGTHLLDADFADRLADYAGEVARRYPHLQAYTPVNEPLTTARFSGLYGHWYPHHRSDASFVRALLNQTRATVLAMREIRRTQPAAQLVQTEDAGFVSATPSLQYQADFENTRRWLSLDLLCGRVGRSHPLWRYLRDNGASAAELMALVDEPCPPDLIGLNHYVTSERFLDERLDAYPPALHGGNGRHRYVDTEAVRVVGGLLGGLEARAREAWERYGLPMAVTETHLGCSREEQLRWLKQSWDMALRLRSDGVEMVAVTAWAAFGTIDWNSLVTRRVGHHEPGLWDVRSDPPRPTALATLASQLARGQAPDHPVLEGPGWWQRALRHRPPTWGVPQSLPTRGRPLLVVGGQGTLGRAFGHVCHVRGLPAVLSSRAELDITDPAGVDAALQRHTPWAVVNAAGFVRVDDAESDPRQWQANVVAAEILAQACARRGIAFITFSSDLVFDGHKPGCYVEHDQPAPLCAYGRAKAAAERGVLMRHPGALVIRTAAFFGPWDRYNFLTVGLRQLQAQRRWCAAADQVVSPTFVPDLVMTALDLLIDGESGVWHLANEGETSWYDFAVAAAAGAGLDPSMIDAVSGKALGQVAARPRRAVLGSARGRLMPSLNSALARYLADPALPHAIGHVAGPATAPAGAEGDNALHAQTALPAFEAL